MVRVKSIALGLACLIGAASAAGAQTSLFSQTPSAGAAPAAPAAEAAPAPKAKPKPKGPVPARSITISNVSGSALTEFVVAADGKSAKLAKELGSNEKAVMKLPAFKSCTVTLIATFERAGEAEQNEQNICKDRVVRLTNGG